MAQVVNDRFLNLIKDEADKLKLKDGSELNPTGVKKDSDGCEYVYSLYSLGHVLDHFDMFSDGLLERKANPSDISGYKTDSERYGVLPVQIAFNLRGYIGAISEDNMFLEEKKLQELKALLRRWYRVGMVDGQEQDNLYQFLWDCDSQWIRQLWEKNPDMFQFPKDGTDDELKKAIDGFVDVRAKRKLMAFKETVKIASVVLKDMFATVWGVDLKTNVPYIRT